MSEDQTQQQPTPAPEPDKAPGDSAPKDDKPEVFGRAYVEELRAEAAKYRNELKAIRDAQKSKEAQELEAQQRYQELYQKEQERAKTLESQLEAMRIAGLKRDIAAEIGLPATLAGRLQGGSEEELRQDAQAMLEALPAPPARSQQRTTTTPNPGGSATGETAADRIRRRRENNIFGGNS